MQVDTVVEPKDVNKAELPLFMQDNLDYLALYDVPKKSDIQNRDLRKVLPNSEDIRNAAAIINESDDKDRFGRLKKEEQKRLATALAVVIGEHNIGGKDMDVHTRLADSDFSMGDQELSTFDRIMNEVRREELLTSITALKAFAENMGRLDTLPQSDERVQRMEIYIRKMGFTRESLKKFFTKDTNSAIFDTAIKNESLPKALESKYPSAYHAWRYIDLMFPKTNPEERSRFLSLIGGDKDLPYFAELPMGWNPTSRDIMAVMQLVA